MLQSYKHIFVSLSLSDAINSTCGHIIVNCVLGHGQAVLPTYHMLVKEVKNTVRSYSMRILNSARKNTVIDLTNALQATAL
jgi:hypothetical protein